MWNVYDDIPDKYALIKNLPAKDAVLARHEFGQLSNLSSRAFVALWHPKTPIRLLEAIGDNYPDHPYVRAKLLTAQHVPASVRTMWALRWGTA